MIRRPSHATRAADTPTDSARRRHWPRWVLAGLAVIVIAAVGSVALYIQSEPVPPRLALPQQAARAPVGPLTGTWQVTAPSVAGFRLRETVIGLSHDMVGRTGAVTGHLVIAGDQVTSAAFRLDLTTIKIGGKVQPQFTRSLGTRADPAATFTLARPVRLSSAFSSGAVISATATGRLRMHGISRMVTTAISGRRNGSSLQIVGSIPVLFSAWEIEGPADFGPFGSLASSGMAEFRLILHRR